MVYVWGVLKNLLCSSFMLFLLAIKQFLGQNGIRHSYDITPLVLLLGIRHRHFLTVLLWLTNL